MNRRRMLSGLAATIVSSTAPARDLWSSPASCNVPPPPGFEPYCFMESSGRPHQIYVANGGEPAVILLHELPGLTDADLATARRLAQARFTVVVPLLFGEPGGDGHAIRYANSLCGDDEFACGSGQKTSPHLVWLRELAKDVRTRWPGGKGIGVIGMCLTGAFPLAMLTDPSVVAPVLCQPTIPFNAFTRVGWFTDKSALGVSPEDLAHARTERDTPLLGIRYEGDWRCRRDRFDRLTREFGTRFHRLELPGSHHSSLGGDFCDVAFEEVVAFLGQQLRDAPVPGAMAFPRHSWTGPTPPVDRPTCGAHR